jgi:two-component system CheB/CheR fusion protein
LQTKLRAGISRAQIDGPELVLQPKSAQTIAVVLHELTTNAVKYGALSVPAGRLLIEWSRGETELVIRWSEAGGPPVTPPSRQGFGTRVVGRVVQAELDGKLQVDWNLSGLVFQLTIPLDRLAGAPSN